LEIQGTRQSQRFKAKIGCRTFRGAPQDAKNRVAVQPRGKHKICQPHSLADAKSSRRFLYAYQGDSFTSDFPDFLWKTSTKTPILISSRFIFCGFRGDNSTKNETPHIFI